MVSFVKAKKRDIEKKEWCDQNDICYIVFPFDQTDAEWEKILNEY